MARAKPFSKEVAFVPSRRGVLLGNFLTDQEVDSRRSGSRRIVEDLIHVVEWGVIFRHAPFLLHFKPVYFWIGCVNSIGDVYGRDPLLNERVLIAADEEVLFRHGIGSKGITDFLRSRLHLLLQAGVLNAQHDQVLHGIVQAGRTINVDVRHNRTSWDSWVVSEVVG